MNHNRRNSWTIGWLALVIIFGVGCTPAKIAAYAPILRMVADETTGPNSAPNKSAKPVSQTPIGLPGKSDHKGKSDDRGRSDDKGRSDDRSKSDRGRSEDKGKSDHKGKS